MNWRDQLFKAILNRGRKKLRNGMAIYDMRTYYRIWFRLLYYLTSRPKDIDRGWLVLNEVKVKQLKPRSHSIRTIFYLHGGGFVMGLNELKWAYNPFCSLLAKETNSTVWMPDYRLAPEHPYPAALEDCLRSYNGLLKTGIRSKDICLVGDSCGAALALGLVLQLKKEKKELPNSIVTISGWTDLSLQGIAPYNNFATKNELAAPVTNFANYYLQGTSSQDPLASPFFAKFKGFPPMYMMAGELDAFYLDTERLAEKVKKDRVDVTLDIDNRPYSYPAYIGFVPEARPALHRLAQFICEKSSITK